MLGSFFIFINFAINEKIRKPLLKSKWTKPVETFFFCFFTTTVFYWFSMFNSECNEYKLGEGEDPKLLN